MLYQGECLDVMAGLPTGSIDMILTDLPYGTTQNKWDSVIPLAPLWEQYKRLAKPNAAIVLFAQVPFSCVLGASNLQMLRYEWIWEKGGGTGFLNARRCPLKSHETLLVFYDKLPTYHPQCTPGEPYKRRAVHNGDGKSYGTFERKGKTLINESGERFPKTVLHFSHPNHESLHPCQKPVALCEYLIKTYTDPGETVLDSCMGSGSTCLAAQNTGRQSIGIEQDPIYFQRARRRLEEAPLCLIS